MNKTVELELNSRDVIHSFWVPAFLYKKDIIPGKTNYMYLTPTAIGEPTTASAPNSAASTTRRCSST